MSTDASPFRPCPLELRGDLKVVKHHYRGVPHWVVGDPLGMEYFRFNEHEYFLLNSFDGSRSLEEIKCQFEEEFNPYKVTHREIQQFATDVHQKGLIASRRTDQGRHLFQIGEKKKWQKRWERTKQVLALRWRGIDPDAFLSWLTPKVGWAFSPAAAVAAFCFIASALVWVLAHWDEFQAKLPGMQQFFTAENSIRLISVVILTKILHELGHGVALKRFGGRCHETGRHVPRLHTNAVHQHFGCMDDEEQVETCRDWRRWHLRRVNFGCHRDLRMVV